MQKDRICPYPGLRPFNEEESIFFKGREEHIDKIISQLQEKKFLMVTGASGDGKSSIIYAGLIPRSRAGFFKTRFNNWLVVDFRPERAPLTHLSRALNTYLEFEKEKVLEEELSYGFSSLVEIYKKSEFYIDTASESYLNADSDKKQELKNKGANLLILVDQFEELFTNAENFNNSRPSLQAITLINLIIETTRIAESENLPIYIVCTMRSDYIGDCAAFKGLPELIVYSQFFVPRLKRQEIHRAILEPAKLSGNKINNRLIERLINELGDGLDQLPILQHALNRIWKTHVDDGADEMDIIHYAKVGGLEGSLLPPDQQKLFMAWYLQQPFYKQKFLESASLTNVLNAHARELFETAVEYCKQHIQRDISKREAHEILQKIFTCLTKINDSRAVRNRSSVLEIKQIVGGNLDNRLIEGLVNVYREPENTLLKPFIRDSDKSKHLDDSDILDITHESLIRNWTELVNWTKQDHENTLVLNDLKKQVERWEQKKRSKDYLLTTGSLSYFKTWYEATQPNAHLVAKYDAGNSGSVQKLNTASLFVASVSDFLKISEAAIKRKRKTIIGITTLIAIVLMGFTYLAYMERNKAVAQQQIADQKSKEAKTSEQQALKSESEAVKAKNTALSLKEKAEISERLALNAKLQAERSRQEALSAKALAETEKKNAQEQRDVAKKEKANAEQEKTKAEQEKTKAELAELKSRKLKLLSIAQNLALKSALYKKNKELGGQLAVQAYVFHKKNGGTTEDPVIYEGLRNAYTTLDSNKHTVLGAIQLEPRTLVERAGKIISVDIEGKLYSHDFNTTSVKMLGQVKYTSPINTLFFSSTGDYLITGHDNYAVCLWNIKDLLDGKDTKVTDFKEFKGHRGVIRSVYLNENRKYLITGGKDSTLIRWNLEDPKHLPERTFKTFSAVRTLLYLNEKCTVVALEDGKILCRESSLMDNEIIYRQFSAKPLCLAYNKNKNNVLVGFSDGTLKLFDLNDKILNLSKFAEFKAQSTAIELITINKDFSLLATAAADKTIKLYNATAFFENNSAVGSSTELKNHNSKVKSLIFTNDNKIIAGCTDRTVRLWETSGEKLVEKICRLLKTGISESDWKAIVGEDIPYETTCKNL